MNITRQQILDTLAKEKPLLADKYGLHALALFGSYAREDATEKSDIDIMVELRHKEFRKYCDLADTLENLFPGKEVQVVSRQAIKPAYFEFLKKDLLYV